MKMIFALAGSCKREDIPACGVLKRFQERAGLVGRSAKP